MWNGSLLAVSVGLSATSLEPSPSATDTAPTSSPTSTGEPSPEPTVTVTVTETAQPSEPQDMVLDGGQFAGITSGLVLIVALLAALVVSQMRRP